MKKLNSSEWAKLAELVSAGAVINSLLYVGYQIKENSREIRAVNRQESVNRSHQVGSVPVNSRPPESSLIGSYGRSSGGRNEALPLVIAELEE